MALNFPNSPVDGQAYLDTASGNRYVYDSANTLWKYASNNSLIASSNNQVIYNSNGGFTGSPGLVFSANTLYANTVNVTGYIYGNGAFLTGVTAGVSDLSPANNWANTKLSNTSGVSFAGNLYFPTGNVAIGNTSSIQKFEVVGNMAVSNFYENDINVASNVTITTGRNAMSAGPVTINSGITVTVPSGSTWTIV